MTDDEAEMMIALLYQYCDEELDQWVHYRLHAAHGEVHVSFERLHDPKDPRSFIDVPDPRA